MTDDLAARTRPSASQLLTRILETPDLATAVRALPAPALAKLIDQVGLEDAGELVALATTEQLARVFDEDLWRSDRAGEDERFDAARFLVWLAVMLEAGDAFVAGKLSELPSDLVTLAFHQQLLVLDTETLMSELLDSDDAIASEKALASCLSEEVSEYQLIARHPEGWDDVLAAILALDRDHHDYLIGLLARCAALSREYIEDNGGLYDVLTSEEMLEADVAGEREDRRGEEGHVAPSSAAAFLKLARTAVAAPAREHDGLTAAYFRGLGKRPVPGPRAAATRPDLFRLLRGGHERASTSPRLLSSPLVDDGDKAEPLLVAALRRLAEDKPRVFAARSEETAYLANVLAAGCSFEARRMRPVEAVEAAIATTSLGLELSLPRAHTPDPVLAAAAALRQHPADALFRVAWSRLYRDVVCVARALVDACEPSELDVVRGLADECPSLDGRFLASAADLVRVRKILARIR